MRIDGRSIRIWGIFLALLMLIIGILTINQTNTSPWIVSAVCVLILTGVFSVVWDNTCDKYTYNQGYHVI